MMKLYVTPGSPYARMARIVVLEKGLENQVEIVVAKTRAVDSPYYGINASGRVPYLVCSDGRGFEESAVICSYLDHLNGDAKFDLPGGDREHDAAGGVEPLPLQSKIDLAGVILDRVHALLAAEEAK